MHLELKLFGVPEIRVDGRPVSLTRRSAWGLLAYLAVGGGLHAREVLTAMFGGDGTDAQARRRISNALADIRRELPACLLTSWHVLGFQRNLTYESDVQQFATHVKQAREQDDPAALRAAAELYRGEFMTGLSLDGAPEFEMWLLLHRESYHAHFVEAVEGLVASAARRSAWDDGVWAARRLLELEPWHEEVHRRLMMFLARSGQRHAALAQFEVCKRILHDELDAEPDEHTVELYEELKRESVVPNNLPAYTTEFIGRDAETRILARQLSDPESRLITIVGPPGSGKTRLAVEVATTTMRAERSRRSSRFADGVFFVSIGPRPIASVPSLIARTLGLDDGDGTLDASELADNMAPLSMLLVLDEPDHSPQLSELVAGLLRRGPHLTLIVTSRDSLHVHGEHVLTIGGLDLPARPGDLERSAAGALLLAEARRADLRFEVPPAARASLVQICHLLHGLPAALILASRVLPDHSSSDLVGALTPREAGAGGAEPWWNSPHWVSVMNTVTLLEQSRGDSVNGAAAPIDSSAARGEPPFALVCTPESNASDLVGRLRGEGMLVCVTNDVQSCLRVATSVRPDVVLIDPRLPRRLAQLLRAHPVSSHASIQCIGEAISTSSSAGTEMAAARA
jgi:DNA-binding SARP family transcriptional activator